MRLCDGAGVLSEGSGVHDTPGDLGGVVDTLGETQVLAHNGFHVSVGEGENWSGGVNGPWVDRENVPRIVPPCATRADLRGRELLMRGQINSS